MGAAKRVAGGLAMILWLMSPLGLRAEPAVGPSRLTNFPIGSGDSICSAQDSVFNGARSRVFDRSWSIVCRDATRPVGQIYRLRPGGDIAARVLAGRNELLECAAAGKEIIKDLGPIETRNCRSQASGARWKSYTVVHDGKHVVVEGVAGYDEALQLALRSVVHDQVLKDPIAMPTLDTGTGGSFYRLQAAQADPATRLEQGYRSNNAGAYAEAVEFFDLAGGLIADSGAGADERNLQHEMQINRGLQLSNLGKFGEADAAFSRARAMQVGDPVQARLARNLEAMHEINQSIFTFAQAILDAPVPPAPSLVSQADGATLIAARIATPLSAGNRSGASSFNLAQSLSPAERAALLDAQATQLRGTLARLTGRNAQALAWFDQALAEAAGVKGGRVTAGYRLRAQIMTEKALLLEQQADLAQAETLLADVRKLIANEYPDSMANQAATAGLAAFYARHHRADEALALYRDLARQLIGGRTRLVGLTNRIVPYFDLLAERAQSQPQAFSDMFAISQTLARPGAASTLEQLARQMEAGDDRSSALYRQSTGLRRDIERAMIQIAQLNAAQAAGEGDKSADIAALQGKVSDLSAQQVRTLDDLAAFPRFRAISGGVVSREEMLALLKPGEAYMKIAAIGDQLFAVYLSADLQTGWKLPLSTGALRARVNKLRDSISVTVNGVQSTYPFDVDAARALYLDLFGPVAANLKTVTHLIFEPDAALLQLPINLLIADQAGVDAYHARQKAADADAYDFTGIDWLGRSHSVSTALSAASFRDVRRLPPSKATKAYLGLGNNQPVSAVSLPAGARRLRGMDMAGGTDDESCNWPLDAWNNPIADNELKVAAGLYGEGRSDLLTGPQFTDTAILSRGDLADFKVIHFATHGLVSAPRRTCQAKPALLTSFGAQGSDGLLEFREIFDMRLNADLVILSACDTAAGASEAATREAGIEDGGGSALDGLVRAFVGAGSRTVIASHWPAPDDFQATFRLMAGLLGAPGSEALGDALRKAEVQLMDDPNTSHPFYWSGFALIGDGAEPVPHGS
jgi:CHAT domain-containing protein